MIIKPNTKRVLCYGDSNTWGQRPDRTGRFAANERWTGIAQRLLGDDYDIVEEGLSSRTTNLDYVKRSGRNGQTYLEPCLESQNPLQLVIIMLGTNDYKIEFGPRPVDQIIDAIEQLVRSVRTFGQNLRDGQPAVAVVSPIHIQNNAPYFTEYYAGKFDERSVQTSLQIAAQLEAFAKKHDCFFFDAATVAQPGSDGVHMSHQGHQYFGEAMANNIAGWAQPA